MIIPKNSIFSNYAFLIGSANELNSS